MDMLFSDTLIRTNKSLHHVKSVIISLQMVLLQSGMDEKWWDDSTECYCHLRNVQYLLADGRTPDERRFGEPLEGLVIPVGAMVEYHPTSAKDQSNLHQFGTRHLEDSSEMQCSRVEVGRVTYWVADVEESEKLDASEIRARIEDSMQRTQRRRRW